MFGFWRHCRYGGHQHFADVLSASYIIPGPNAVEIIMHCGMERGSRAGLVIAGICYILPAMLICLFLGYLYQQYSALPDIQDFIFGLRPATTALVTGTVLRLSKNLLAKSNALLLLCLLVFAGAFSGVNEGILIITAGLLNYAVHRSKGSLPVVAILPAFSAISHVAGRYTHEKFFFIFLKIGALLYGSGYVLFAYMDASLVGRHHWLTHQQLTDAIAVGQITPGPILSSATFAGYLVHGISGGIWATAGIFLPSFFLSFFLHKLLSYARKSQRLRAFLDGLSAASVSIIAVVGLHLLSSSLENWRSTLILVLCLVPTFLLKKLNTVYIILLSSLGGFLLRCL
ncbi:chromate efflux transporter [Niabella sp. CC-SYL272]|uniref:chromate efflux transporter n=1 Tax=Niabella agricola TaxID=2891571 RepID=UPI001F3515B0|nr:chromate efflux transporter [Niabella agricola]MCF3108360.1 chromate efflux transporter [Niabella agricola]